MLWPYIFESKLEIKFAYKSFKWSNNAKDKAAVIVVIIGVGCLSSETKFIYKKGVKLQVRNINPYLNEGGNISLPRRNKPISSLPEMV